MFRCASRPAFLSLPHRHRSSLPLPFRSRRRPSPRAGGTRDVMKCHDLSCDVMFGGARRPFFRVLPSLHRSSFPLPACLRRGPFSFRAYRVCPRAPVGAGAVRAPDCAREPGARRTSPVRSVGLFSRRRETGDEATSGCRSLVTYLTMDFQDQAPGEEIIQIIGINRVQCRQPWVGTHESMVGSDRDDSR